MSLERIVLNFAGPTRRESLEGHDHLVVPCVMIKEGIWEGSEGPIYYSGEELAKSVPAWNHKPAIVYHPKKKDDGTIESVCDPTFIANNQVGILLNADYEDGKLKGEAWLNVEKTNKVDGRIITSIEKGEAVNVSTGLVVDNVFVSNEIEHGGKKTKRAATNFRPDHLAILPDVLGACSVADGAGLLMNERKMPLTKETWKVEHKVTTNAMSFDDIQRAICSAVENKFQRPGYYWNGYVHDVYDDFFVYRVDGKYFSMAYNSKEGKIELAGEPVEVVRVTEYRKVSDGSYVGNAAGEFVSTGDKTMPFNKQEKIATLIGNGWEESDRAGLEATPDKVLEKMFPASTRKEGPKKEEPKPDEVKNQATGTVVQNSGKAPTFTELLNSASPAEREMWQTGMAAHKAEVERLVGIIVNSGKSRFTKEMLEGKPLGELQAIAELVPQDQTVQNSYPAYIPPGAPPYFGAAGGPPVYNAAKDPVVNGAPLLPPSYTATAEESKK